MEVGSDRAGLQHIIKEHGGQFAQRGVPEDRIANTVLDALETGRVVGTQGKQVPPRVVYEFDLDGAATRMAIDVGNNGFIVSANFRSMPR